MVGLIVTAVVLVLAAIYIYEALKEEPAQAKEVKQATRPVTADEAGPTGTGRFRALQALGSPLEQLEPIISSEEEEDDEPLPDPFK